MTEPPNRPPLAFFLAAAALVFAAYSVTVWAALDLSIRDALLGGVANTVPILLFGLAVHAVIVRWLARQSRAVQALGHLVLCTAFSLLSFWLLIVLLGLVNSDSPIEFSVRPFPRTAFAWQTLENATTYAVLAALSYLRAGKPALPAPVPAEPRETERSRYFVRSGDEMRPVDLERVICVSGADDYAEVTLPDGKHLVRMTLAEFERRLDPVRYARIHRSWIVDLDRIEKVEPAGGGRLLVHLTSGQVVPASRSGSKLLRDRVI
jgi:hypothetical protein